MHRGTHVPAPFVANWIVWNAEVNGLGGIELAGRRDAVGEVFAAEILPVLTPLSVDPAHPFPYISNLSLNLAVLVRSGEPESGETVEHFARVKVPQILPRLIEVEHAETAEAAQLDGADAARFLIDQETGALSFVTATSGITSLICCVSPRPTRSMRLIWLSRLMRMQGQLRRAATCSIWVDLPVP